VDELILRPSAEISLTPASFGFDYSELSLPVAEGRSIVVWHVPADQPKALLLILPGSDANKGSYAAALPLLVPRGYECVLMDYEGYGNSPGAASLANCVDDAYTAAAYAVSLSPNTVVFGASLGSPLAVRVAADMDFRGIILEGTLVLHEEPSLWLADHGNSDLGGIANAYVQATAPEAFDILKYITMVQEPKLFMHSPDDEVTPYAGARRVFDAAPEPKEFWDMRGGHGQMIVLEPQAYADKISGFIDAAIAQP
jgi:pimeloyl-ACP methyl ester carboxylesterase